jgi:hypothetical protein
MAAPARYVCDPMFYRAIADTRAQLGGLSGIFMLSAGAILSWLLLGWFGGAQAMTEAAPSLLAGLSGAIICAMLLFAFNLIAAPARIARERIVELERDGRDQAERIAALTQALEAKPKVGMSITGVRVGSFDDGEVYVANLLITNTGVAPISFPKSASLFVKANGEAFELQYVKTSGEISIEFENDYTETFSGMQCVDHRLSDTLGQNATVGGPMILINRYGTAKRGDRLVILLLDSLGTQHEAVHTFTGIDQPDGMYRPHPKKNGERK